MALPSSLSSNSTNLMEGTRDDAMKRGTGRCQGGYRRTAAADGNDPNPGYLARAPLLRERGFASKQLSVYGCECVMIPGSGFLFCPHFVAPGSRDDKQCEGGLLGRCKSRVAPPCPCKNSPKKRQEGTALHIRIRKRIPDNYCLYTYRRVSHTL